MSDCVDFARASTRSELDDTLGREKNESVTRSVSFELRAKLKMTRYQRSVITRCGLCTLHWSIDDLDAVRGQHGARSEERPSVVPSDWFAVKNTWQDMRAIPPLSLPCADLYLPTLSIRSTTSPNTTKFSTNQPGRHASPEQRNITSADMVEVSVALADALILEREGAALLKWQRRQQQQLKRRGGDLGVTRATSAEGSSATQTATVAGATSAEGGGQHSI